MTEQISQRELRNDSGRIMRGLEEGKTYVITRNRQPVGELRPFRRKRFVDAQTVVAALGEESGIDYRQFREDLNQVADQHPSPRG